MIAVWILLGLLGLMLALLLIAVIRTVRMPSKASTYVPDPDPERAMAYARKLSRMIQYETVSRPKRTCGRSFSASIRCWRSFFPLSMRSWRRRKSTATCCIAGKENPTPGPWC